MSRGDDTGWSVGLLNLKPGDRGASTVAPSPRAMEDKASTSRGSSPRLLGVLAPSWEGVCSRECLGSGLGMGMWLGWLVVEVFSVFGRAMK